ncbi:unnamed protein product [Amoebophrya sp. A120]|nr:unnamed protein product [Amoebophrya sp. A120]
MSHEELCDWAEDIDLNHHEELDATDLKPRRIDFVAPGVESQKITIGKVQSPKDEDGELSHTSSSSAAVGKPALETSTPLNILRDTWAATVAFPTSAAAGNEEDVLGLKNVLSGVAETELKKKLRRRGDLRGQETA